MSNESIENEEYLDAEASPDQPSSGVKRVNNLPLFLIGGAAGVFLLVMVMVASDRADRQNNPPAPEEITGKPQGASTQIFAQEFISGYESGGIVAPSLPKQPELAEPKPAEVEPKPAVILAAKTPEQLNNLQAPSAGFEPPTDPLEQEIERMKVVKLHRLREAANAKTAVNNAGFSSSAGSVGSGGTPSAGSIESQIAEAQRQLNQYAATDPTTAYLAKLDNIRNSGVVDGLDTGGSPGQNLFGGLAPASNTQGATSLEGRWNLNSRMENPSPFELKAGFVIPGVMISGINSELPGQVMAQVSYDIYDTATGRHLLIPQGSRLNGVYKSDVSYGQSRVLVAWQRLVFPDGKSLDIGSMAGADEAGYSGFNDKVNNHYIRLFGSAILMSAITAGVTLSQNRNKGVNSSQTASEALSESLGQQLGQVSAELISKNLNIAPTLEIRPGYKFNIIATKDLKLDRPYQSFDY